MISLWLLAAHLCGDFLLQNRWMQRKSVSTAVCAVHVAAYGLAFLPLVFFGALPPWALAVILAEHFLQDRYALHLRWMRFYSQSTSAEWPTGPLCVDQAMHLVCIAIVTAFI